MLEIQKFIRNQVDIKTANSILEVLLNLRITESELLFTNGRTETVYIYNYHQWETPYESSIGREARGLILNEQADVVSFSFQRFPNYRQDPEADSEFHWDSAYLEEKLDGTLIVIYSYKGHNFIQTRGLVDASGEIAGTGITYNEAVMGYLHKVTDGVPFKHFYGHMCYVFEYIGPGNRHVTPYNTTSLVLLSIFNCHTLAEMSTGFVDSYVIGKPFSRPVTIKNTLFRLHDTIDENINYHMSKLAPLEEGYVLVDKDKRRLKIKSKSHVEISNALNIGDGVKPIHFAKIVLGGEHGEMKAYFPEYGEILDLLFKTLGELREECADLWATSENIVLRKDFAVAISECPLRHVLFKARDIQERQSGHPESIFENIETHIPPQNLIKLTRERRAREFYRTIDRILDIGEK